MKTQGVKAEARLHRVLGPGWCGSTLLHASVKQRKKEVSLRENAICKLQNTDVQS